MNVKTLLGLLIFSISPLYGQAEEVSETSTQRLDLLELLEQGGVMMYPLAFLSVVTLFLVVLYLLIIRRGLVINNRFINQAENMIVQGDYHNLSEACQRNPSAVAKILGRSVDFLRATPSASLGDIRDVAEAEGSRQAGLLSQRIAYLADVGSIAPMVGLLGTVIGMIKSFMDIAEGNFEGVKQMQLASGVSEALITTASGLVIGIIAVLFYSIFRGRVQRYIADLEAASTHLMAVMSSVRNARAQQQKPVRPQVKTEVPEETKSEPSI